MRTLFSERRISRIVTPGVGVKSLSLPSRRRVAHPSPLGARKAQPRIVEWRCSEAWKRRLYAGVARIFKVKAMDCFEEHDGRRRRLGLIAACERVITKHREDFCNPIVSDVHGFGILAQGEQALTRSVRQVHYQ